MKFFLSFVFLTMIAFTILGFNPTISGNFFAGNDTHTHEIAVGSVGIQVGLLLVGGYLYYNSIQKNRAITVILFGVVCMLWFVSGRTIGIINAKDRKIITGWFYMGTNKFEVNDNRAGDGQKSPDQTTISQETFWRLHIKNESIDEVFFVGPIIWNETLAILDHELEAID